jgi:type IV pilus biogenesis protein CpaD/CtpE
MVNPLDIYWIKIMKNLLLTSSLALFALTACETGVGSLQPSMFEESSVTQRQIELVETRHTETMQTRDVTYDYLMSLSDAYLKDGESPLYVVFAYDPNQKNAKLSTHNRANIVKGQLGKLDIRNAIVKTVPVIGSNGDVVISYDKVKAQGPSNCGTMPGMGLKQTGGYGDYGMGCTVKDMMARQIANPSDLEGVAGLGETYDGSRANAAVNRDVRAGEVNEPVPSYILSEIGAGE